MNNWKCPVCGSTDALVSPQEFDGGYVGDEVAFCKTCGIGFIVDDKKLNDKVAKFLQKAIMNIIMEARTDN